MVHEAVDAPENQEAGGGGTGLNPCRVLLSRTGPSQTACHHLRSEHLRYRPAAELYCQLQVPVGTG